MQIYDTLSGKKKELKKPLFKSIKMFVCGPTVYDTPHIGNARTFVTFDILVRYLRSRKFKIFYLQNITDLDDKIINRARENGIIPEQLAKKYEDEFLQTMDQLGVCSVNQYAKATDFIPQIVVQVRKLISKGKAYKIDGDGWYFDISTFPNYGKLSRRTVEQAEDGVSRIDESDKKRNRGDFCLWKFSRALSDAEVKEGEPVFAASIGAGRPGWHIEDTAITESFLGPRYYIHGGAQDLKFPHHEAEIAQQESISGKHPLAKIWMHVGFLKLSGKKMSKSEGNFLTITQLLEKHSPNTFRLLVFSHHYRSPIDYTPSLIKENEKNLLTIIGFVKKLELITSKKGVDFNVRPYIEAFHHSMQDDFNTPKALAVVFELMNKVNKVWTQLNHVSAMSIRHTIIDLFCSIGIVQLLPEIPESVQKLFEERELSRDSKQFDQADTLRKKIESLGYLIEDTPKGSLLLPKQENL